MLLVIGTAPAASAVDLGPGPAGPAAQISPARSLPVFLDASRLPDIQAAWRARFGGGAIVIAVPAVGASADPEGAAINEARQTLSRGEQVSLEAAAVRQRAEELSRRFAAGPSEESGIAAPGSEPATVASKDGAVAEAASVSTEATSVAADPRPLVPIQTVAATAGDLAGGEMVGDGNAGNGTGGDAVAPASMLGGPPVAAPPEADAAPVIEEMATKPRPVAKLPPANPPARRVVAHTVPESPGLFGIFSSSGSSGEEETAPKSDDPDKNTLMPTEIRSFGWNAQP
ncbi:MAG: hypothetical protein WDN31_09835 [Hyphomicrobium sp.]